MSILEDAVGFEPTLGELQSRALPLGYASTRGGGWLIPLRYIFVVVV